VLAPRTERSTPSARIPFRACRTVMRLTPKLGQLALGGQHVVGRHRRDDLGEHPLAHLLVLRAWCYR
jgi:hypothetical protein